MSATPPASSLIDASEDELQGLLQGNPYDNLFLLAEAAGGLQATTLTEPPPAAAKCKSENNADKFASTTAKRQGLPSAVNAAQRSTERLVVFDNEPASHMSSEGAGCHHEPNSAFIHPTGVARNGQRDPNKQETFSFASDGCTRKQDMRTTREHLGCTAGAKLGTYSGSTCLETFLARFDSCAKYFHWNNEDKLFQLCASLEGPAGQILWDSGGHPTVEEVIRLLRSRFGNSNQAERFRAELRTRRRSTGESLQQLYQDVCRLLALAYPGPSSELSHIVGRDAFLDALDNPAMRIRILEKEPHTLDDAFAMACRLEALDKSSQDSMKWAPDDRRSSTHRSYVRAAASNEDQYPHLWQEELLKQMKELQNSFQGYQSELSRQRGELDVLKHRVQTCSVRGSPGYAGDGVGARACSGGRVDVNHDANMDEGRGEAPKSGYGRNPFSDSGARQYSRVKRCWECGSSEHLARQCPKMEKNRRRADAKNTGGSSNRQGANAIYKDGRGSDVYMYIQLNGHKVCCLLDTGCETSVIARRLLPDVKLQPTSQTLFAANGTRIPLLGRTTIDFTVHGEKQSATVVVTEAIEELILGIDWLQSHRCRWEFGSGRVKIGRFWIKLHSRTPSSMVRRIYVESDSIVSARSQRDLRVKATWPDLRSAPPGWIFEPTCFKDGVIAARTLFSDQSLHSAVRILNFTDEPFRVASGTLLGKADLVAASTTQLATGESKGEEKFSRTIKTGPATDELNHVECVIDALPKCLTTNERELAAQFIRENASRFSKSEYDLGRTDLLYHSIDTGDNRPFRQPLRRHPRAHLPIIDNFVDEMLKNDVIEPVRDSAWASNVVLVRKRDGSLRFCVDYRRLNSLTQKDSFPLPRIDSCLDSLGGSTYFSTLDLRQGYFQLPMAPKDKQKTAFITRRGIWAFKVMSFGLCNAPSQFSRLIEMVLAGLSWEVCLAFLDDIIVFSKDFEQHLERLQLVFDRLMQANLKLKPSKCKLFQTRVQFLGHVISKDGVSPDTEKVDVILKWPIPRNLTEVRAFIGLINYYRKFVKSFAEIARPLHELTRKGSPFVWSDGQQQAFDELKQRLVSAPILVQPRDEGGYVLDTDASANAVGAVLSQWQDGELKVIAFASRALSPAERAYCVTRRELLAVVYGLRQFRHYLLAQKFELRTDHSALTYLLKTPEPVGQQARYLDLLAEYNFSIVHRSGSQHGNVDALSRRPCDRDASKPCGQCRTHTVEITDDDTLDDRNEPSSSSQWAVDAEGIDIACRAAQELSGRKAEADNPLVPNTALSREAIVEEQNKDATLSKIKGWIETPDCTPGLAEIVILDPEVQHLYAQKDSLELRNGILYRRFERADGTTLYYQLIVPRSLRTIVLDNVHSDVMSGHFGVQKTQEKLQKYAYWQGYKRDVETYVRRCVVCCRYRHGPHMKQGKLQSAQGCTVWQKIHIDLTGPHVKSRNGFVYLLTVICSFTKYLVAVPLRDKTAKAVAKAIVRHVYLLYSAAELVVHDQGREFCNEIHENVCQLLAIQDCKCSPYRPSSNGQIERVHRTMNEIIAKMVDRNQRNWDEVVPHTVFAYNTAVHSATSFSPFYLMFMREPNVNIQLLLNNPLPDQPRTLDEFTQEQSDRMRAAYSLVRERINCSFQRAKRRYDHRVKPVKFHTGLFVWHFCPRRRPKLGRKWQLLTDGPYKITRKINDVNFVLQKSPRSKQFVTHVDRMTLFEGDTPPCWKELDTPPPEAGKTANLPAPAETEPPSEPPSAGRSAAEAPIASPASPQSQTPAQSTATGAHRTAGEPAGLGSRGATSTRPIGPTRSGRNVRRPARYM